MKTLKERLAALRAALLRFKQLRGTLNSVSNIKETIVIKLNSDSTKE